LFDVAPQLFGFLGRFLPRLADGFLVTLWVAALAAPAALACGILVLLPRISNSLVLRTLAASYIEVMRNTPLLLQMYLIYFGLPLVGLFLSGIACGVMATGLQHGAFFAEVFRGGVESVGRGQWEAARSIGMRRGQAFRLVVLPLALMKVIPPSCNQLIVLVKDTSLVSAIGVMEVTLTGKLIIERTGASYEVFLAVAAFYLLLTTAVGGILRYVEARAMRRF
jgi:His/Glu/Gln/Arg/opine family amino acid ABC transporter permease subunit